MLFSFLDYLEFWAKIEMVLAYIGLFAITSGIGYLGFKLIQWIF